MIVSRSPEFSQPQDEHFDNEAISPDGHPIIYVGKVRKEFFSKPIQPLIVMTGSEGFDDFSLEVVTGRNKNAESLVFKGLGPDLVTNYRKLVLIESDWVPSKEDERAFRRLNYVEWDLDMPDRDQNRRWAEWHFGKKNFELMRAVPIPEELVEIGLRLKELGRGSEHQSLLRQ